MSITAVLLSYMSEVDSIPLVGYYEVRARELMAKDELIAVSHRMI